MDNVVTTLQGVFKLQEILERDGIKKLLEVSPNWEKDIDSVIERFKDPVFVDRIRSEMKNSLKPEDVIIICQKLKQAIVVCTEEYYEYA